ncbi:uncharacterized protein CC84DRAFT_1161610 [Paraphaeosphaeria sporulosa]|uniref:Uncharacterized protein n=1 Tax=Paraphaeosphaeria sporulosa TaxID=1460663 RepID=A0A177CVJ1_9PLEO|nr:uncharacterized protein CC84DRAFT_1161610 [Paraphaeosphaeria sporulosa]OAG10749.1 hypothetical protein CC84DRAFT_1161610 [Paraphaeosphaeria sporulosa]
MKKEIGDTKDVLQDIVIVVSLVSTLAKSFGSAGDLYRKLKKKTKNTKKGLKEDIKQEIEEHLSEPEGPARREARSERGNNHHRRESRSRSRHPRDKSCDSDRESIEHSYELVRAEYDRGYHRLGEKFAVGDLITRNQLQAQIILLQQRLLYTYEDVILHSDFPRHTPSYHLKELVHTTRTARSAVIDALTMQYQRMLPALGPTAPDHLLPGAYPSPPTPTVHTPDDVLHDHHTKTLQYQHHHRPSSRSPARSPSKSRTPHPSLYCSYALTLQRTPTLTLPAPFLPDGTNRCPSCSTHIPASPNKAWEIVKASSREGALDRTFWVGTRFLAKCHREGGGLACILCSRWREADTVCGVAEALVEHIWRDHGVRELEGDEDVGER